jgi:hypothetical protein
MRGLPPGNCGVTGPRPGLDSKAGPEIPVSRKTVTLFTSKRCVTNHRTKRTGEHELPKNTFFYLNEHSIGYCHKFEPQALQFDPVPCPEKSPK